MYYIVDRAVGGCDPAVVHLPSHHNSAASLNIKQTQCKQCKQLGRSLYFSLPPPKGDEETVEISASPSLRREQYSSASMAEWTTETTITSASSSICRSPPAAPAPAPEAPGVAGFCLKSTSNSAPARRKASKTSQVDK